ncbi:MAG: DUF3857 domain-containing protein [Deltaproteobacteria bacterium]|nr:DUF3857 domain-containing protein [Deltaproteobacteria bacterium]
MILSWLFGRGDSGEVQTFEDLNFRFREPPRPWSRFDAKAINPNVTIAYLRSKPMVSFMIIADNLGAEIALDTAGMVAASQAHMKSISSECELVSTVPRIIAGIEGQQLRSRVLLGSMQLVYIQWMACKNGYCYQLMGYSHERDGEKLSKITDSMFERFELIDPDRVAWGKEERRYGDFSSEHFGLRVDLRGTLWAQRESIFEVHPAAETGGAYGPDAGFLIYPVHFGDAVPDMDGLTRGFLKTVGWDSHGRITGVENDAAKGLHTRTFSHAMKSGALRYRCRTRIVRNDRCAFMILVWEDEKRSRLDSIASELFSRVTIDPKAKKAFDWDALPLRQRKSHAQLFNNLGLWHFEHEDYGAALLWFKKAVAIDPADSVLVENTLETYNRLGNHNDALAFLDGLDPAHRRTAGIRSWHAWHLRNAGRVTEAAAVYKELFDGGHQNLEDLDGYTRILAKDGKWEAVESAYATCFAQDDSIKARLQKAALLVDFEKVGEAIALLKDHLDSEAPNPDVAFALISAHEKAGQHAESLALCDKLLAADKASAFVYYKKAMAEYALKWFPQARASLEKALALSPRDAVIKDFYLHVSGLLGSGDNSTIKNEIPPVLLPGSLARKIAVRASALGDSFSVVHNYRIVGISLDADGTWKKTTRSSITVLDEGGVNAFSTVEVDFDPLSEQAFVNKLLVRDEGGAVVARGNPSTYYVIDGQRKSMATHDKTLFAPVPNLMPGRTVELCTTIIRKSAGKVSFEPIVFAYPGKVRAMVFYFLGDLDAIAYESQRGAPPRRLPNGLSWEMDDPPVYRYEPLEPRIDESYPVLAISSAGGSWKDIGQSYLDEIRDKLRDQAEVKSLAAEITAGARSEQEKIDRLASWVQRSITYKPIEFGRRSFIPETAAKTIENKYGDCKDHAVLLHKLLEAVSIPSRLALVNTTIRIFESLPSSDQFDHVIVYVPGSNRNHFIDTTGKDYAVSRLVPPSLVSERALVIEDGSSHLVSIPRPAEGSSAVSEELRVEVRGSDLVIENVMTVSGYYAIGLRHMLKSISPDKRQDWIMSLVGEQVHGAEIERFEIGQLSRNESGLVLKTRLVLKERVEKDGGDLAVRLPNLWMRHFLAVQAVKARSKAFRILLPLEVESITRLTAPSSCTFDAESIRARGGERCTTWETELTLEPHEASTRFQASLKAGLYPAGDYASYRSTIERALRTLSRELRCRQGGSS